MAIPACPRFSDLVYLYSSVCYACTSSTLFRPSIFVLCNGYTWSTLFRRSILICILLFVVTVPRTRSSDLLYYLYFFVCLDCTLSTLFRPTIFVLVCLWWLHFVYAFQTYSICTRLSVMAVLRLRLSELLCLSVSDGYTSSTLFRALVCVCFWWLYFVYTFQSCCICLFLMAILHIRFSELLCLSVSDVYSSSALFRPTVCGGVCAFQSCYICTRLFLMDIPLARFSELSYWYSCLWCLYLVHAFSDLLYLYFSDWLNLVHSAVPLLPLCCSIFGIEPSERLTMLGLAINTFVGPPFELSLQSA